MTRQGRQTPRGRHGQLGVAAPQRFATLTPSRWPAKASRSTSSSANMPTSGSPPSACKQARAPSRSVCIG